MKNRKKQICSLLLASTLILSTTGCSNSKIQYKYNDVSKKFEYTGSVSLDQLYIVEVLTRTNEKKLYLTQYVDQKLLRQGFKRYEDYKTGEEIRDTEDEKILNIIPLELYLVNDNYKKDRYNGYELDIIFDEINNNYKLSNTEKKLEKK